LLHRAAQLRESLHAQGWNLLGSMSQIVPLVVGDPESATRLAGRLFARGLFVPAIRPPSVPAGQSLLRISLSYGHSSESIERLCATLGDEREQFSPSFARLAN
jgi:8-amino-7-oxononanoate synthase